MVSPRNVLTWFALRYSYAVVVTIPFSSQTARFIKVVQTGTVAPNWWSLYEFNVYN